MTPETPLPPQPPKQPPKQQPKPPDEVETECEAELGFAPPSPAASFDDASPGTMRSQYHGRRGGPVTTPFALYEDYDYGYCPSHGRCWRQQKLGPKKRGPCEWSLEPVLTGKPFNAVNFVFADGQVFQPGAVTEASCLRVILIPSCP